MIKSWEKCMPVFNKTSWWFDMHSPTHHNSLTPHYSSLVISIISKSPFWPNIIKPTRTHTHTHAHTRTHTHTHTHTYTHTHTHTYTHTHTHIYIYICLHAHTDTHALAHIHTHNCKRTHIYAKPMHTQLQISRINHVIIEWRPEFSISAQLDSLHSIEFYIVHSHRKYTVNEHFNS